jgi:hypothetical protein
LTESAAMAWRTDGDVMLPPMVDLEGIVRHEPNGPSDRHSRPTVTRDHRARVSVSST